MRVLRISRDGMSETKCVGLVNLIHSLGHNYGNMPKLLGQYE